MTHTMTDEKDIPTPVNEDDVIAWLRDNPNFLQRNPEVCDLLAPPREYKGKGVIDFQQFMVNRLRQDRDGIIEEARYSSSFGNTVLIDHGQGVFTRYAHLANLEPGVEKGREIGFGQPLGIMGTTGNSTGVHLHFEVLTGTYVAPGRSPNLTARNPLSFPAYQASGS